MQWLGKIALESGEEFAEAGFFLFQESIHSGALPGEEAFNLFLGTFSVVAGPENFIIETDLIHGIEPGELEIVSGVEPGFNKDAVEK